MRPLLRTVMGGDGYPARPLKPAEQIELLREENESLSTELTRTKLELEENKRKLRNKKNELEKARSLKDDLIEETAASNRKFRKEIEGLELNIRTLKQTITQRNSDIAALVDERDKISVDLTESEKGHVATKVNYNTLEKRYGRIRYTCTALTTILLIVALYHWHAIAMLSLGFIGFVVKLMIFIANGGG